MSYSNIPAGKDAPNDIYVIIEIPVGKLNMEDDGGIDAKLIAVPHEKLSPLYNDIQEYTDLPKLLISQVEHFFLHYKDLEPGKWVKLSGWEGADVAKAEVLKAIEAAKK